MQNISFPLTSFTNTNGNCGDIIDSLHLEKKNKFHI